MDDNSKSAKRTSTFYASKQVVGEFQILLCSSQSKVTGLHDERFSVLHNNFLHQLIRIDRAIQINIGIAGMLEHPEIVAKVHVDRTGTQLSFQVRFGSNFDSPAFEGFFDVFVRKYHISTHPGLDPGSPSIIKTNW